MKYKFIVILVLLMSLLLTACIDEGNKPIISVEPVPSNTVINDGEKPGGIDNKLIELSYNEFKDDDCNLNFSYDYATAENILIYYTEDNDIKRYGFMDMEFNKLSPSYFDYPTAFSNDLALVTIDKVPIIIDKKFNEISLFRSIFNYNSQWVSIFNLPIEFNEYEINEISLNSFKGFNFDKYSGVDPKSQLVSASIESSETSSEGYPIRVYGFKALKDCSNENSDFMIPPIYERVGEFKNGLAPAKLNGLWGYIDEDGSVVIDFQYSVATDFDEIVTFVGIKESSRTQWGLIDLKGNQITDYIFSGVSRYQDGYALVSLNNSGGTLVDFSGKVLLNSNRISIFSHFVDGYLLVNDWEKGYYFINEIGENISGEYYSEARKFSNEVALVKVDSKWGYIGKSGSFIIEPQFQKGKNFDKGLALVTVEYGESYLVDKLGNKYFEWMNLSNISKFNEDGYALAYSGIQSRTYYIIHIEDGE